ncbi:sporangiospore maturation cell wall hydrolase GsmA [Hamadaea tsunoensis]|uniref:sporangiospore maturation cell wall hydrolase GsmA n=1 Tax=Hamadaea tsunoensis TaxID=53368 RepID=UPI000417A87F|nr:sporangiospore maturation cell wall hydrolase GsmA [Hamadaea tsunoensis]
MKLALAALVLGALAGTGVTAPAYAAGSSAIVRASGGLNVRSGAATDRSVIGAVTDGSTVHVVCQVFGQQISGSQRTSALWDRLDWGHGHVADAFVQWPGGVRPKLPWCGDAPTDATHPAVHITSGVLNVRTGPGTGYATARQLADGTGLTVECRAWGTKIEGNGTWDRLAAGQYVADQYVRWSPARPRYPWCGQDPATVPPATTAAFLSLVAGPAQQSMRTWQVPASVTMAQAVLESGWGRSTLTRLDHSYFGMKCFGDPGGIAIGCSNYLTSECSGSTCHSERADFRAYRRMADSFDDHGRQLATLSRYATAMKHRDDPEQFARELQKAGYATSQTYANSLIDLIRRYGLRKYDKIG